MLEVKEEAADVGSKVSSYRSGHQTAARPWIPGTGQSMSPTYKLRHQPGFHHLLGVNDCLLV